MIDNPPFSILNKIVDTYLQREVPFFLFAPSLVCLSDKNVMKANHVITGRNVTYENGARVNTSFVTSFGYPTVAVSCPELAREIDRVDRELRKKKYVQANKGIPQYVYPDHVLTAAMLGRYAKHGIEFEVCNKAGVSQAGQLTKPMEQFIKETEKASE